MRLPKRMKFTMMHAALGIWILAAVFCMGRGDHHFGHHQGDQDTAVDSVSLVSSAGKKFAYQLYRKLAAHASSQGKNIFFSPASISSALAALSVGARGETHQQLFSGLGFNNTQLTQTDVDQAYRTLLGRENKPSNGDINEGTAVFLDNHFKPLPEFLDTLKQSYFSEGFNVDFTQTTESANTINKYVEGKTNGKIDKMVDSLEADTVMYLLSYIYFRGKWTTPFNRHLTMPEEFRVDENTKVEVEMMNIEDCPFDTYYDEVVNTSVVRLPFNNSYSMLLLLPDDMETLESVICPGHVKQWMNVMRPRKTYDLYVPKFSIKASYSLNAVLTEMGMTDMFGPRADFSGITEGQKVVISEVAHKATLDVSEEGAEAAAATGISMRTLSGRLVPVLYFNRPFMVVITEHDTENVLFMGKIINPNI